MTIKFFNSGKSWRTDIAAIGKILFLAGAIGAEFGVGGTTGHVLAAASIVGREIVSAYGSFNTKDKQVQGVSNALNPADAAHTPLTTDIIVKHP